MIQRITAVIPVSMPLMNIGKFNRKDIGLKTLNLIVERNKLHCFDLNEYGQVFPIFSIEEISDEIKDIVRIPISLSLKKLLCITAEVELPEDIEDFKSNGDLPELTSKDMLEFHKSIVSSIFKKRIYDYAIALNMCGEHYLCLCEGIIKFDNCNYLYRTTNLNPDFIFEAITMSEQINWPQFKSVTIDQVLKWLNNQQGFLDGFGGGKVGRALNAIVNISFKHETSSPESLFWAMIGLESIYTSGKSGLLEQVRDKSQTLLGKQDKFKKILNRMYDIRSRFVHGDLDFATPNYLYDSDELEKYQSDICEAQQIAVAVLLCTIQELVIQNWNGVSFNYSVADSQEMDKLYST
ncbi:MULTISPECIES: HEPN domain-containing protein [Paenibacillus]|uniref:Uncharacterized protein n=1 Tax=Paenibacillus lautus TaxID=1401 RepID=A0A1R1AF76_PAELA|nr:HEPN domain-containing protein [Paenibacillus lautus]OME84221.1 hypothetical protein BK123_33800 [Paenibacillus lautus]